ncbi:hypothetical protein [Orenia metallireducens]|uniref:hypothetical protein n=1 Tax=Orenia metallireducens TaxID=1413210 RepID=UPI00118175A1|nr:hypothetical protein [Orenia metallireducens]
MVELLDKLISSTIKGLLYLLIILFLLTSIYSIYHLLTTSKGSVRTIFNPHYLYKLNSLSQAQYLSINL